MAVLVDFVGVQMKDCRRSKYVNEVTIATTVATKMLVDSQLASTVDIG